MDRNREISKSVLISDLMWPVKVGMWEAWRTANSHRMLLLAITTRIVSKKLRNLWRENILSGVCCVATQSFVAHHTDTCHCMAVVLFFWESNVAVVGLIRVRKAQIWGRKIASKIMA